jgi:hypothetical protein
VPAVRSGGASRRRRRRPWPPKPVAITVTWTSPPIESSITAPKMTFAFWSAAPGDDLGRLVDLEEADVEPPVTLSRIPVAPSIDASSSGEETAGAGCLGGAVLARRAPMPHQRRAGVAHDRAHVGEVEVDEARLGDQVGDALHALAKDVVRHPERLDDDVWRSTTCSSRSFSITISVSTRSRKLVDAALGLLGALAALEPERAA